MSFSTQRVRLAQLGMLATLLAGSAGLAQASIIKDGVVTPTITAGAPPDSPSAHIDPNTASSDFSGVVSINIRYPDAQGKPQSFICSGALVSKRSVVTAGHCVDTDGNGHIVDLHKPGADVRVVFNSNGTFNDLVTASSVSMNPDYQGFNNCPDGSTGCLNDDVAVVTLERDAPASAKIYRVGANPVGRGTHIVMAGYGTSGDGVHGYTVNPSFFVKRTGENYMDLFDPDDEGRTSAMEVWYADFDGAGKDTFCTRYGSCTPVLPNNRESGIGGGDSGGPSFVRDATSGEYILVANNTFSGNFRGQVKGTFGTYFGGILLSPYLNYLNVATNGTMQTVPEPSSLLMFGLGMGALALFRRRRS